MVTENRKAKTNFFIIAINQARGNVKKTINQKHNKTRKMLEINLNNNLLRVPLEIAEAFNHCFVDSVADITQGFPVNQDSVHLTTLAEPVFTIKYITEPEVMKIISSHKPIKAKDVYGIDRTMLKDLGLALVTPITSFINLSISNRQFPNA